MVLGAVPFATVDSDGLRSSAFETVSSGGLGSSLVRNCRLVWKVSKVRMVSMVRMVANSRRVCPSITNVEVMRYCCNKQHPSANASEGLHGSHGDRRSRGSSWLERFQWFAWTCAIGLPMVWMVQ